MERRNSTVLVTGVTGNGGPYVTGSLVDRDADVVGTDVTNVPKHATLFDTALVLVALGGTAWPYAPDVGR